MGFPPVRAAAPRRRRRIGVVGLIAIAIATVLGIGTAGSTAEAATSLTLKANTSRWAKIGPSRLTSIAEIGVKVPSATVEFGVQFRAKAKSSGYRTKVTVAPNGTVTGSFSRVTSSKQTVVGTARSLGFSARPGDTIYLQATVTSKKTVRLYLRAWKAGSAKPTTWQATATDSSNKRIKKAGATYIWARTPAGSPKVALPYSVRSIAPYSNAKASAVGKGSPGSDNTFSIAVIGDTQTEVTSDSDSRFANRTAWLAANKSALDLRYVVHTGDVVNWGWLDAKQYTRARNAMAKLTAAKLPWSVAVGNHDTRAVGWNNVTGSTGYGGAAYANNPECRRRLSPAECDTKKLVRKTAEFNASFPAGKLAGLGGTFESGKIDNAWTTFTANGTKWLVLNIEFAPRKTAVEWARKVVASHPKHNVIIDTHYYLTGSGGISTSNAGYGETSGKYIYDKIVSKYRNVKIVLSGHTGAYTSRTDKNNGNTTVSYLGNDLGGANNPVRILTINASTGKITSTVYSKVRPGSATTNSTGSATISVIK